MTIYTSYYGKSGEHPLSFSISSIVPKYLPQIKTYPSLAPKWEFVLEQIKGTISWEQYTDRFMNLIVNERKLNAHQILEVLPDGARLLCYERSDEMQFCHRRLVADWIQSETGVYVPEYDWVESKAESLLEW